MFLLFVPCCETRLKELLWYAFADYLFIMAFIDTFLNNHDGGTEHGRVPIMGYFTVKRELKVKMIVWLGRKPFKWVNLYVAHLLVQFYCWVGCIARK